MKQITALLVFACCCFGQKPAQDTRLIESIQGPALYKAYCSVCHGKDGQGKGPMANSLKVAPSDLTRIASRNRGEFPSHKVERIIAGQEAIPGGHGPSDMPVWGPIFSQIAWDQDLGRMRIDSLTRYIESLQRK